MERSIDPIINDDGAALAWGSMSLDDAELVEELQLQEVLLSAFQGMTIEDTSDASTDDLIIRHDHSEASKRPSPIADPGQSSSSVTPSIADPGPSSSSVTPIGDEFYCPICMESMPGASKFSISSCGHAFCWSCIVQYIATKIGEKIVHVNCPGLSCEDGFIELEDCRDIIPLELFNKWDFTLCESVLGATRFYCPFSDCSAALFVEEGEGGIAEAECPHCHRLFCARCMVPWHDGVGCEEFQELGEDERGREDVMVKRLAGEKRWQRCPQCRMYVEKSEGCMFMKCRCGYCFCYACASPMTKDLHYCKSCKR
ncbi:E3 ubiquitin-protein ligase RSL1-like isoform X2 [Phragmites australis]|uniref:E3 ubiquitin-protein ligase RSL1-like isoform X2 n=1 Tax=Phragmites australis TaxID=29695 RepID=UPI002D780CE7|nr:E3 ubiquitin-protein ligase RSL1-like isoform X2 [Phragmites australis]